MYLQDVNKKIEHCISDEFMKWNKKCISEMQQEEKRQTPTMSHVLVDSRVPLRVT